MKRLLIASVVLVAIAALPMSHLLMGHPGQGKGAVFHNGHVICVSHHAIRRHVIGHRDLFLGPCRPDDDEV